MLPSAEVRWFWPEAPPEGLEAWFLGRPIAAGGGTPRIDRYLIDPGQRELGIKERGDSGEPAGAGGVEVKGLVETRPPLPAPFAAPLEIWTKWTSPALRIGELPRVTVHKTRRLRKFDTGGAAVRELALDVKEKIIDTTARLPAIGCHMELVALEVGEDRSRWWTFGFEAFGPFDAVAGSLARAMAHVQPMDAALLSGGQVMSYPAWLATVA